MGKSKIEWTDSVWNPITGCSHAGSPGCDHCYAKRMAQRLKGRYGYPKNDPFKVTFHPDRLDQPLRWKKPRRIFVCSMSDLFHEEVYVDWIDSILNIIRACPQHTFMILTKRPENIEQKVFTFYHNKERRRFEDDYLPKNIWLGVTCENQHAADERIPILLQIPAVVRFISCEPLLSEINLEMALEHFQPLNLDLSKKSSPVQWVIVGGESGARPMHPDWARSIRNQCQAAGVPFFFKQWGEWSPASWALEGGYKKAQAVKGKKGGDNNLPGYRRLMYCVGKKKAGRMLDGRTWDEYPTAQKLLFEAI